MNRFNNPKSKCGSALIAVIIFSVVLSALVGSFLRLSIGEARMAERSIHAYSLLNLAESGLEEGLYAITKDDWSDWVSLDSGNVFYRPFQTIELGRNVQGRVRILVTNLDGNPEIVAEAFIDPIWGSERKKQLVVQYQQASSATTTRTEVVTRTELISTDSLIASGGMITKGSIKMVGNITANSYSSDPNRVALGDQVVVATDTDGAGALVVGGSTSIAGFVGTAGVFADNAEVASGAVIDASGNPVDDGSRYFGDFAYDWPEIVQPNWSLALSIPDIGGGGGGGGGRGGRGGSSGGGAVVLGLPLITTLYKGSELSLGTNDVVRINGPVKLYTENGFDIKGTVIIGQSGSLEIFTPGDMQINGQAFINESQRPQNLRIFGTAEELGAQSFRMNGGATMDGVIYAPNTTVKINGSASMRGSLVAGELEGGNGTFNFSYDETLGENKTVTRTEEVEYEDIIVTVEESEVRSAGINAWFEITAQRDLLDIDAYIKNENNDV